MTDGVNPMRSHPPAGERAAAGTDRLREVTREFEALFLEMILKQARSAARAISSEEPGATPDFYESLQDRELARALARGPGIGLAEMLYRQLQQRQLQAKPEAPAGPGGE